MFLFIYLLCCFFIIIPLQLWMYDVGIHMIHKILRYSRALNWVGLNNSQCIWSVDCRSDRAATARRRRHSISNRYTIFFSSALVLLLFSLLVPHSRRRLCQQSVYESMPSSFLLSETRCEFSTRTRSGRRRRRNVQQ